MKEKSELISRLEALIVEFKDAPPVLVPQLKMGDVGERVTSAQTTFKTLGFEIDIDGEFGPQMESVVKQFQEANQIAPTGVIGAQTLAKMGSPDANGPIKVFGGVVAAAELARAEAKKELHWRAGGYTDSEAEKYLASVRKLIGMPVVDNGHNEASRFPWCAAFIFWNLLQQGIDMSHLGSAAAYVPAWVAWAKSKGYWHPVSEKSFNPRLGDIGINDWTDNGIEEPDHISFILAYDGGAHLTTAEGNTSSQSDGNGDSTAIRTRHWDLYDGFIRIA